MFDTMKLLLVLSLIWMKNHRDIHKFQLNGYYTDMFYKWFMTNKGLWFRPYELILIGGMALLFLSTHIGLTLLGLALLMLHFYFYRLIQTAYPAKKKMVYTPRVKRMLTTDALLFIALTYLLAPLPNTYIFILCVFFYVFSPVFIVLSNGINAPIEKSVNNHYISEAKDLLKANPDLVVIGITGSYGKTSTKNVLHAMLSKDFNVLMTPESYNTTMGVTRTIRSDLKPTHQVFIAEMGAKKVGDIRELCEFVNPSMGIITSIGPQHLDTFKTFENIISTKGELFKYLRKGGTAFVNASDPNVLNQPKRDDLTYVTFSSETLDIATDYAIEAISIDANGSSFTLCHQPTQKKVRLSTKLLGRHNLSNIVAGAAVALSLGIPMERLGMLIADLQPVEHRLSHRRVNDTYTLLDDAFNSNPIGSKMALEVLETFKGNQKIIITPGMIELGDRFYDLNKEFGLEIADVCDYVILVGKKQTRPIQDGLKERGYPDNKCYVAKSIHDAFDHLSQIVKRDDVVLIENDLPDTFNE